MDASERAIRTKALCDACRAMCPYCAEKWPLSEARLLHSVDGRRVPCKARPIQELILREAEKEHA